MPPAVSFVLATNNPDKAAELRRILDRLLPGFAVRALSGADFPGLDPPEETGATFEANALLKARAYARATGLLTLADDSGLLVDALDGRPGVLSARYGKTAAARNARVLEELAGLPPERRTARFECVVALAAPRPAFAGAPAGRHADLPALTRRGTVEGRIAAAPRGQGGFGYDPIFELTEPPHAGRTVAQLDPAAKDALSHRGRALAALAPDLRAALSGRGPLFPDLSR